DCYDGAPDILRRFRELQILLVSGGLECACYALGSHESGREGEDSDVVRLEIARRSVCDPIDGILSDIIKHINEELVTIPRGYVDDQSLFLRQHHRCGKPTGNQSSTHAGREHPVPVPQRLFVERSAERAEVMVFISAPGVVHQQVESSLLALYAREYGFHVGINGV